MSWLSILHLLFSLTECKCLSKPKCKGFINDNCRDNPCQNGQCIDLDNDYKCECESGYKGKNCDKKKCTNGYVGENCDKEKCGNGYAGENCDLPCPVVEYDPLYSTADVSYFRVVDGICIR